MKLYVYNKSFYFKVFFSTLLFMYCQNPVITQPQLYPDFIDESINSTLTDYFENDTTIPDGLIPFVFFQYYRLVHDSADHYRAMIRLYTNSICIRHQQVFDFNIGFRPSLYVVHIRKDTHNCTIEQVDAPPLFTSKPDTIKVMFSEDLYERILSKERDSYFEINMHHTKKRIVDYCKNTLPADRFTYVEPPSGEVDLHHDEDIYSYLNLKACFDYISITEEPDTINYEPPVQKFFFDESPDSRYQLFYVIGRSTGNTEYFYKDNQTGKLFQIKNVFEDMLTENTFCNNSILVIDIENGRDYFDSSNRPYGVHLEIDLAKGKLIRAIPFGYLSFPERIRK